MLADDLGYNEIGSYGQKIIQTPELDRIANNSMRFTNFYAGNVALELRSKGLIKEIKPDGTPVSNGDLEINKIVTKKILEHKIPADP